MGGGNAGGMMNNPMFLMSMLDGKEGNSDETLNSLIQMNMMNQMNNPAGGGGANNMMANPLFLSSLLGDSNGSDGGLDMTTLMLMGQGGLGSAGGLGDLGL